MPPMLMLSNNALQVLPILAGVYFAFNLVSAIRIRGYMNAVGRNGNLWFLATLLFTAIPYMIFAVWHNFGWLLRGKPNEGIAPQDRAGDRGKSPAAPGTGTSAPPPMTRCPHCGAVLPPASQGRQGGVNACPNCGMARGEETVA